MDKACPFTRDVRSPKGHLFNTEKQRCSQKYNVCWDFSIIKVISLKNGKHFPEKHRQKPSFPWKKEEKNEFCFWITTHGLSKEVCK